MSLAVFICIFRKVLRWNEVAALQYRFSKGDLKGIYFFGR